MESIETVTTSKVCDAPGPAARAELEDDVSRVARAIAGLPESQQEVLQLRFQHGLSYREVSHVTGRTKSNVGVLIHKGIKALRERLGSEIGPCLNGSLREGATR